MKEKVKQMQFNFVIAAVLYVVLGIVLLVWPDVTSKVFCYSIGTVLLIYGVVNIVAFVAAKAKTALLGLELCLGIISAGFGLFTLLRPEVIRSILPILVGIFIIVTSCISVKRSFEMRRYMYERWWVSFLLAVIAILIGILIVAHPGVVADFITMLCGAAFLYVGVCDIASIWKTRRLAKEYAKKNPVDVDPIDPV